MSETAGESYKTPADVDTSLTGLQERLVELQPSLKALMGKALELFEDVYPQAPPPLAAQDPIIAYATKSTNICPKEGIPMARELTIVLGARKWVRVFRNTDSSPDIYPRERLWLWRPEGEMNRQVNVMRTHSPSRVDYPYDIETADYDKKNHCVGLIGGAAYYGQEPYIVEVNEALDEARSLAERHGFVISI